MGRVNNINNPRKICKRSVVILLDLKYIGFQISSIEQLAREFGAF